MPSIYEVFSGTGNRLQGPSKKSKPKTGIGGFFSSYWGSFSRMAGTNFLFVLCNFPILLAIVGMSGIFNDKITAPATPLYAQLYGIMQYERNPAIAALHGIFGSSVDAQVLTPVSIALRNCIFLAVLTIGITSAGMMYILRETARRQYVTVWHDFFRTIKKNFKQAFIIGIIDCAIIFFLIYDYMAYSVNTGSFFMNFLFFATILFAAVYFVMRFYIYLMVVSFDFKIGKLFKNAFILTMLGFKQSILILLGNIALLIVSMYIFILLPTIGLTLPFLFTVAFGSYIGVFAAFPIIDRYVVQPYYEENPEERPQESNEEPIFKDNG